MRSSSASSATGATAICPPACFLPRLLLFACLLVSPVPAVSLQVELALEQLTGAGLTAQGVEARIRLGATEGLAFSAAAARLVLENAGHTLAPVALECPEARLDSQTVECRKGRLRLGHPWLERPALRIEFEWRAAAEHLYLVLRELRLAGGRWSLTLDSQGPRRRLSVKGRGVDLSRFARLLTQLTDIDASGMSLSGRGDMEWVLTLDQSGLLSARWRLDGRISDLSFLQDAYLGEGLQVQLAGALRKQGKHGFKGTADLTLKKGALLTPYLYLEAATRPISLTTDFDWKGDKRSLRLEGLSFRHPTVVSVRGDLGLSLADAPRLEHLRLSLERSDAQRLYETYFEPMLSGTLLESARFYGGFALEAMQTEGGPLGLHVKLHDLGVEDAPDAQLQPGLGSRFAIYGLQGDIHWTSGDQSKPTRVSWNNGHLLGALAFGATRMQASLNGSGFSLSDPLELPLLDGELLVDRLDLSGGAASSPKLDFDGVLTPVTLRRLTDAFDWPPLSGKVSGVLPGLSLEQGELRVDGNLLVKVFGGEVLIRHLRLSDIFGALPVMLADIELKGMDLNELTRTFSFGKITGRLDGRVDGLRMEGWRPVAFDARFETPEDDASDKTINQRAVDNISNLGGAGVAGALSRSFLGFFEDFNYERLGIGCVLRDGVCRMSGVRPAEQGYYLVEGSGIPQINIVGFNHQADWDRLVRQLQQISAGGSPVVQ